MPCPRKCTLLSPRPIKPSVKPAFTALAIAICHKDSGVTPGFIAAAALIITAIVIAAKRKRKKLEEKKKPPIVTPPVWSGKRVTLTITGQNGLRRTVTVLIGESGYIIGRSAAQNSGIDLNIEDDMYISRRQCRLAYRDGEMIISNLSETNITKLNGKPIPAGGYRLADGDDIEIGQTRIVASIDWGCNEMALS